MTPERLRFLEPIVQAALDCEGDARAALLDSVCGDESALRRDVETLIRASEQAEGGFLSVPAVAWGDAAPDGLREPAPGRPAEAGLADGAGAVPPPAGHAGSSGVPELRPDGRLGPYRILSVLGEGGMGTVFLAQQTAPMRRRVAIKLIRPDRVDREMIHRFEAERRALARMNHPNIAQALEAGTTTGGRLYFVMEFVPGLAITEYCDRHRLDLRARLELFTAVCSGVQHAHEKGILHRDLKPSNVLVTEYCDRPVPKIIDFGIAKAIERPYTQEALHTGARLLGTPAYWSPEALQVSEWGTEVDTRSDVYSLGALLYELLVGVLPFETRDESLLQAIRRILEEEPVAPSARLAALGPETRSEIVRRRRLEAPALAKRLSGDLDWMVLKALAKERSERYSSPAELAADVVRHLCHEPVLASPRSTAYQVRKFVRRHRAGVASVVLVVAVLLAAALGMTVQAGRASREAERANREAEAARQVSDFLVELFRLADPGEARGRQVTAREILERGADRVRDEMAGQPLTQARLMESIGTVYRNLGLLEPAAELLEEALAIRERAPDSARLEVAEGLHHLASIYTEQDRYPEADALFRRALAIREEHLGPSDLEVAKSLNNLAVLATRRGRYEDAEALHRRTVAIKEEVLDPRHPSVATSLTNLALVHDDQGRLELAEAETERALEILEAALGPDHPDVAKVLNNLAALRVRQGRYAQGEPLFRRALAIQQKVLGPDHFEVTRILNNLAELCWYQGRHREAESLFRRALDLAEEALGPDHTLVAHPLHGLARLYQDQGRHAEAEPLYARALAIRERALEAGHPRLDETLSGYAALLDGLGRAAEAEALHERIRSPSP